MIFRQDSLRASLQLLFILLGEFCFAERATWHLELRGIGDRFDHARPFSPVAFSPDSTVFAISLANELDVWERLGTKSLASQDVPIGKGIGIWKVDGLEFVKWIESDAYHFILFSPDGRSIGAIDESNFLQYDVVSGYKTSVQLIKNPTAFDRLEDGFAWLSDNRIAVICRSGLSLYSLDGKLLGTHEMQREIDIVSIQSSGDLVLADSHVWNTKTQQSHRSKDSFFDKSVFRPGTQELWSRGRMNGGPILSWKAFSENHYVPFKAGIDRNHRAENASPQYHLEHLAFSPNGKVLASVGDDRCIHLWDVDGKRRIVTIEAAQARRERDPNSQLPDLRYVCFSPNGQWLLAGTEKSVNLFNTVDLKPHITPERVHVLTQYFAGSKLVEEIVTNPQSISIDQTVEVGTTTLSPGTRIIAKRTKKKEYQGWYNTVVLAKVEGFNVQAGPHYAIHFEGYSQKDDELATKGNIRLKKDTSK